MKLRANEAIQGVFDFVTGGVRRGFNYARYGMPELKGQGIAALRAGKRSEKTFGGLADAMFGVKEKKGLLDFAMNVTDEAGNVIGEKYYSGSAMLGTTSALGIGYRFLSGGGIYRDKNGNTDWAGVPFV